MLLGVYYNGVELHRNEKMVYARFLSPHRVISTCSAAGGLRDDLSFLYNHQSCEPTGHNRTVHRLISREPKEYRRLICELHNLPDESCATLGTAANMRYAAVREASFRELTVVAVCTGGVESNAGRAGDPATVYEWSGAYERVSPAEPVAHGTINTMLFINHELTEGAMVRAVMTATEAKTAALQELVVGSRYSKGLATGTGTDQIGIASRLQSGAILHGAGKHCVLGELIGRTVHDAIRETLKLQNALTADGCRSTVYHLRRFGVTRDSLLHDVTAQMNAAWAELLRKNFTGIERDPLVVAAVAALVHVRDEIAWGILPEGCEPELRATYGAQIAAAVSGNYRRLPEYMEMLTDRENAIDEDFTHLIARAIATGFCEKWEEPDPGNA
ncbi:MAG: adenosylcobinamide amidohydrolase [Acidobacteriota bacterium]|jgi:adenosylcobinamide amidohydrolase|nr:adenosylcobinamide amidohydrolase [Acidobacteriota bacterium]